MVNVGPLVPLSMENYATMRDRLPLPFHADPRISNRPPPWMADRADWGDLLGSMSIEDCDWIGDHWRMATDGRPASRPWWPSRLARWLEHFDDGTLVIGYVAIFTAVMLLMGWLSGW